MRKVFSEVLEKMALEDDKIVFITGDLGYNAFEKLQSGIKDRFINAGVAEQNMIGLAAGLAYKGYKVFCYSIAPFATFRCLEQIRIDVCFHKLPVFVVANGGGYGYGIMGATHHALEDIACMSSLPNITCYIPAFAEDVGSSMQEMVANRKPAYLRLGLAKKSPVIQQNLEPVNTILSQKQPALTVIAMGPVINNVLNAVEGTELKDKVDLFSVTKLPFETLSDQCMKSLSATKKLLVVEEHIVRGGVAEYISLKLLNQNVSLNKFRSLHAMGYPNELYGDQNYHLLQSGLDSNAIRKTIEELINQN